MNPLSRVIGESESRSTSAPPVSRASSTTTIASGSGTDLSEIEASLVLPNDEDGEEDEAERVEPVEAGGAGVGGKLKKPKPTMTRRERKKLGLPKNRTPKVTSLSARPRRVILKVNGQRPGAIETATDVGSGSEAWVANGSGRMDNRGFRELKI